MPREKKSKKRSAITGGRDDWRPSETYFIDNALGRSLIASPLIELGATVHLHTDHFAGHTPDTEWIPQVTERGWVILTKDRNIKHNPLEHGTVMACGARYVCVLGGQSTGEEVGRRVAALFRTIDGIASVATRPLLMRVGKTAVTVLDGSEWVPATKQHENPSFWRRRGYGRGT